MRTTLDLDTELLAAVMRVTGERTKTAAIESALRALLARAALVAALDDAGGSHPGARAAARRRMA